MDRRGKVLACIDSKDRCFEIYNSLKSFCNAKDLIYHHYTRKDLPFYFKDYKVIDIEDYIIERMLLEFNESDIDSFKKVKGNLSKFDVLPSNFIYGIIFSIKNSFIVSSFTLTNLSTDKVFVLDSKRLEDDLNKLLKTKK